MLFHAVCNKHEASVRQLEYLYSVMVKKVSSSVCKVSFRRVRRKVTKKLPFTKTESRKEYRNDLPRLIHLLVFFCPGQRGKKNKIKHRTKRGNWISYRAEDLKLLCYLSVFVGRCSYVASYSVLPTPHRAVWVWGLAEVTALLSQYFFPYSGVQSPSQPFFVSSRNAPVGRNVAWRDLKRLRGRLVFSG